MLYFLEVGYSLCGDVSVRVIAWYKDNVKVIGSGTRIGLHDPWGDHWQPRAIELHPTSTKGYIAIASAS